MSEMVNVAVDAMGGDNAPAEIVKGAVDAVSSREDIKVFLVGQEDVVREELQKYPYPQERIEVVDAPEVIEMAEPPVQAIRKKKQSSLVVGMNMVKQREADAFVSAGSSGAVLVGGQTIAAATGIYSLLVGFFISLACIVIASLCTKAPSEEILVEFNKVSSENFE